MKHFDKIWIERPADAESVGRLEQTLGISEVLARLLVARGFHERAAAEGFLNPTLDRLIDPFVMKGMSEAVSRIRLAISKQEQIWIYGDYDVDGITAISLLCRFFKWLGYPVSYYIPDRLEEGYGISEAGVARVRALGCSLMISVDCGITSVDRVEQARALGMDVIITDHHEPHAVIPAAVAVVNPKQPECPYPEKTLSGVGIAYKLAQAIAPEFQNEPVAEELLQIAALGTVADIVPLIGENRILVRHGIEALRRAPVPGTVALMKASGVDPRKVGTGHIGFMLAPRINAAGRIDAPQKGVELLITENSEEAEVLAEELSALNEERQRIERGIFDEAVGQVEALPEHQSGRVLVVAGEGWHPGVIGIVASRIVERYYRPCILLNAEGDTAKGSARSIEGFNLFEALSTAKELLQKYGGHEMAAGMTLPRDNINALRAALNSCADEMLTEEDMIPRVQTECALTARQLQFSLLDDLDALEPFGQGNPKPIFLYRGLTIDQRRLLGKNQEHVKLITHDGNRIFEAIGFRWPNPARLKPGQRVDLAFVLERNTFNGVESLQLQLKDARIRQWELYQNQKAFRAYWASCWTGWLSLGQLPVSTAASPRMNPLEQAHGQSFLLCQKDDATPLRLLLWSPEAYEELLAQLQDIDKARRMPVYFNECPADIPQAAVINPDFSRLKVSPHMAIVHWEKPPHPGVGPWAAASCKTSGNGYNDTVGASMVQILDQLVPSKEALAATYRSVRETGEILWSPSRYQASDQDPLELLKEEVRLWILAENGLLLQQKRTEGQQYTLASYTGERISIVDSAPYRYLMALKNAVYRELHE